MIAIQPLGAICRKTTTTEKSKSKQLFHRKKGEVNSYDNQLCATMSYRIFHMHRNIISLQFNKNRYCRGFLYKKLFFVFVLFVSILIDHLK